MHQAILAQRKAKAVQKIVARATALVQHLELDPALSEGLQPRAVKDANIAEMMRLEALAALMDQLAAQAGAPAAEQPDTAVNEFSVAPAVTAVTAPEAVEEAAQDAAALDEPPAKKTRGRSSKK